MPDEQQLRRTNNRVGKIENENPCGTTPSIVTCLSLLGTSAICGRQNVTYRELNSGRHSRRTVQRRSKNERRA